MYMFVCVCVCVCVLACVQPGRQAALRICVDMVLSSPILGSLS